MHCCDKGFNFRKEMILRIALKGIKKLWNRINCSLQVFTDIADLINFNQFKSKVPLFAKILQLFHILSQKLPSKPFFIQSINLVLLKDGVIVSWCKLKASCTTAKSRVERTSNARSEYCKKTKFLLKDDPQVNLRFNYCVNDRIQFLM